MGRLHHQDVGPSQAGRNSVSLIVPSLHEPARKDGMVDYSADGESTSMEASYRLQKLEESVQRTEEMMGEEYDER